MEECQLSQQSLPSQTSENGCLELLRVECYEYRESLKGVGGGLHEQLSSFAGEITVKIGDEEMWMQWKAVSKKSMMYLSSFIHSNSEFPVHAKHIMHLAGHFTSCNRLTATTVCFLSIRGLRGNFNESLSLASWNIHPFKHHVHIHICTYIYICTQRHFVVRLKSYSTNANVLMLELFGFFSH